MNPTIANPFIAAAKAAWGELTTDDARTYYERTAWWAAQHIVDDTIITITYAAWAIHAFGSLAYDCGALFREQVEEGYHADDAPALPPATKAIAALPPAKPALAPAPRRRNATAPVAPRTAPIPVFASYTAPTKRFWVEVQNFTIEDAIKAQGGRRRRGHGKARPAIA